MPAFAGMTVAVCWWGKLLGKAGRAVPLLVAVVLAALLGSPAFADPQTDYMLNCRGCHGPDGTGLAGAAPSFRGQLARFLSVPGGREYLIQVPGTAQSALSDARVAALLNWLLSEFSPEQVPAGFVPYREDEVARWRRSPLTDVQKTRAALLRAIEAYEKGNHEARHQLRPPKEG